MAQAGPRIPFHEHTIIERERPFGKGPLPRYDRVSQNLTGEVYADSGGAIKREQGSQKPLAGGIEQTYNARTGRTGAVAM